MRKALYILLLLFPCINQAEMVMINTVHYPPYANKDSDSGYVIELVKASFKEQSIDVKFNYLPMKRTMHVFFTNKGFLALTLNDLSPNQRKHVTATHLDTLVTQLFYLKDNPKIPLTPPYSNLRIGVFRGAADEHALVNQFQAQKTVYNSVESAAKMLIQRRIDAMMCLQLLCENIKQSFPDVRFTQIDIGSSNLDFIMHKQAAPIKKQQYQAFKEGFKSIIENGIYQQIRRKYLINNKEFAN